MKKLSIIRMNNRLQKHPAIVFAMFSLSLISAILTIVLGWTQFYDSFLSKELYIPVWVLVLSLLIIVIIYMFRDTSIPTQELETIEGKDFGVQQIELDGKNFVNCTFDGSELVFRGKAGFSLQKNHFNTPPRIAFHDHAGITLAVIKSLQGDPIFKPTIDKTFNIDNEGK